MAPTALPCNSRTVRCSTLTLSAFLPGGKAYTKSPSFSLPTYPYVTFRFTLYSIPGGRKFDLSLRADDELREMDLIRRAANFSYMDDGAFVFMDAEDYTQYPLSPELVGDNAGYIVEGIEGYYVQLIDDAPVGLQVPSSVILTVVDTAPEMKGSSATKRNKPAKLNTGIELQVPEYISNDEKVWVNTITGEFAGRA